MDFLKFEEEWIDRSCIKPGMIIKTESESGEIKFTVVQAVSSCKVGKHGSAKTIVESKDLGTKDNNRRTIYKASDKAIVVKPIKHTEEVAYFDGDEISLNIDGACKPYPIGDMMSEEDKTSIMEYMDNNPDCEGYECTFRSLPNIIRLESIKRRQG